MAVAATPCEGPQRACSPATLRDGPDSTLISMRRRCGGSADPASAARSLQYHVTDRLQHSAAASCPTSQQLSTPASGSSAAPAPARHRRQQLLRPIALAMLLAAFSLWLAPPPADAQAIADAPRRPPTPEEAVLLPPYSGFTAAPSAFAPTPDFDAEAAAELKQVGRVSAQGVAAEPSRSAAAPEKCMISCWGDSKYEA